MADYFDELNAFANRLVGDAQGMTQDNPPPESAPPQSFAVGEPDPTGGRRRRPSRPRWMARLPTVYWWQPRRYFTGMSGRRRSWCSRRGRPSRAEPSRRWYQRSCRAATCRRCLGPPPQTPPKPGRVRLAPVIDGRPVRYRIGAYIVPSEPSLPFSDYFRQFEFADPEEAKNKVAELAKLGIPPYYWDGRSWIPLYRSA